MKLELPRKKRGRGCSAKRFFYFSFFLLLPKIRGDPRIFGQPTLFEKLSKIILMTFLFVNF